MFGRLTDDEAEWMGVESRRPDGTCVLWTFLDEGFHDDWDSTPRGVEDPGCLKELSPGTYQRTDEAPELFGAGRFDVTVGAQTFECLRVFDILKEATERDILIEAYLTEGGRTVLFRRYEGNLWGKREQGPQKWGSASTWAEDLPSAQLIVMDGMTFVHHYDSLPDSACGIAV